MGQRAEELLMTIPEIQTVARKTGRAELDEHALGVNVSEIEAPFELKDRSRSELVADVREKLGTITGANIEIGQPISHRIDAMLSGTDFLHLIPGIILHFYNQVKTLPLFIHL